MTNIYVATWCHKTPLYQQSFRDYIMASVFMNLKRWKKTNTKLVALILNWKLVVHHTWIRWCGPTPSLQLGLKSEVKSIKLFQLFITIQGHCNAKQESWYRLCKISMLTHLNGIIRSKMQRNSSKVPRFFFYKTDLKCWLQMSANWLRIHFVNTRS